MKASRECTVCGRRFEAPPSSRNRTCSPACSTVWASRHRGPYRDSANRAARLQRHRNDDNSRATEAALSSPLAGRAETNIHAKEWALIDPACKRRDIRNLHHFIRCNPDLFEEEDRTWKRQGGKRGTGGEYCNASAGLQAVRSGRAKTWKGWSLE